MRHIVNLFVEFAFMYSKSIYFSKGGLSYKSTIVSADSDIKYSESETANIGLSLSRLTHIFMYLSYGDPDCVQMLIDKIHHTPMQHIVQLLAKLVVQNIKDDGWN